MVRYPAKYTEVLINLLESEQVKPLIDNALSGYPIYVSTIDHEYIPDIIPTREEINRKLLNYYKYREIGFETVGRFLDELQIAMNEIMPYYNQLMFTQDQDYNVIYNVDYVRTRNVDRTENTTQEGTSTNTETNNNTTTSQTTGTNSSTSTTESTGSDSNTTSSTTNGNSKNVKSDTPQDSLNITAANIDNVTYANEVNWNKDSATSSGTSSGSTESESTNTTTGTSSTSGTDTSRGGSEATGTNELNQEKEGTEAETETTKGNYGVVSAQDLVMKYRETIINIEQMIINDPRIKELFMTVY